MTLLKKLAMLLITLPLLTTCTLKTLETRVACGVFAPLKMPRALPEEFPEFAVEVGQNNAKYRCLCNDICPQTREGE